MLNPTLPITTGDLLLRPFTMQDLDAYHAYHSLPEVARYLYWDVRSREEAREALAKNVDRTVLREAGDSLVLAVEPRSEKTVVGEVLLAWISSEHGRGEVGFIFHPAYQRRGYGTQAARRMLALGFEDLGLHRIIGRCEARNVASAALMDKLGMRREAHFRENEWVKGEWNDELVYAMLASEWEGLVNRARSGDSA